MLGTRPRPGEKGSTMSVDFNAMLRSTDLQSPNFSAHHFLQRVLSHRYENKTSSDDNFDSDAVLKALDTVESALRRRRDAAIRDEQTAREDLRNTLTASSKRRDLLLTTAHTVSTNVTAYGDAGREASVALRSDLASLKSSSKRLADL